MKKDFVRNSRFVISREAILEQIMHDARRRRRGNTTQGNSADVSNDTFSNTHEDIEIVPVHTMGLPVSIAHGLHRECTRGRTRTPHIDSDHLHEGYRLPGNNSDRNTSSQTGNENQNEETGIVSLHVSEPPTSFIPSLVPEDSRSHIHSTYI